MTGRREKKNASVQRIRRYAAPAGLSRRCTRSSCIHVLLRHNRNAFDGGMSGFGSAKPGVPFHQKASSQSTSPNCPRRQRKASANAA